MHYLESFAPLVLVCELSMMLAAAVCVLLWIAALGESGRRIRGVFMALLVASGSWLLWMSNTPELVSAHLRFAIHRGEYIEAAKLWNQGETPQGATIEGGQLYFCWHENIEYGADYGVVYDSTGKLREGKEEGELLLLHRDWYYRKRSRPGE